MWRHRSWYLENIENFHRATMRAFLRISEKIIGVWFYESWCGIARKDRTAICQVLFISF
jgi:hypothetical protein